jgi:Ala-tRNA(Pro) deacylase
MTIYEFLYINKIDYSRYNHPAVFTVEEANRLVPDLPGIHTKNLFLRDKKATQFFLLVCADDKTVDLKLLATQIGVNNLSLASSSRLQQALGITPGAVSILALINDRSGMVQLLMDEEVYHAPAITAHPLVNTTTLVLEQAALRKFLETINHSTLLLSLK